MDDMGREAKKRDWRAHLFFFYKHKIFSKVKHLRGFTRVKMILESLAKRDLPEIKEGEVEYVEDMEWENLIILDGCRHDIYEEVNGVTDSRISAGSMSQDFIKRNFSTGSWDDVVYITANPFLNEKKFKELTGKKPENVFHTVFHTYMDSWNSEENTVMPDSVVRDALTAEKLFPDKRKIIHFMQPHHPFVKSDLVDVGFRDILSDESTTHEWELAEKGKLDHQEVIEAYKQNLELVMPYVEELRENLSGKTIITADHGNYIGENGFYGHPRGKEDEALRKVPKDSFYGNS